MNTNLCGWVNSLIQADTTAIFNQYLDWYNSKKNDYESWYSSTTNRYQADMSNMELQFQNSFNTWFHTVKNTLGADVAGNLLNHINSLAGKGRTTETVKGNADAIVALEQKVTLHYAENATESKASHIQIATQAEVTAGTIATKAVTPKYTKTELDKKIDKSIITAAGDLLVGTRTIAGDGKVLFNDQTMDLT